jgi:uncharacterized membrane protein HdeD (DUF308 family)
MRVHHISPVAGEAGRGGQAEGELSCSTASHAAIQKEERAVSGPQRSPTSASSETQSAADGVRPPAPAQPVEPPGRRSTPPWRRFGLVVLGLLTVGYGLLVMSLRPAALASVAVLAGVALMVGGVVQLGLAGEVEKSWRWLAYVGGVVVVVAGVAALVWPALTLFVLALVIAWSLVINGVVRIIDSVAGRSRELWWLGLLAGVLELGLGLWAIGSPGRELLLLVNLIGIYLIIAGVDAIVVALTSHQGGVRAQTGADPAR